MKHGERGSAAIETAIGVPAFMLFVGLVIGAGRVGLARQAVTAAAAEGARSASLARAQHDGEQAARSAVAATVANQGLRCAALAVDVDSSEFKKPVGVPAVVRVRVTCDVILADVAVPGLPGSLPVSVTMESPLDTYRRR